MDLMDLTPGSIFETVTFNLPEGADPRAAFLEGAAPGSCEALLLDTWAPEGYPSSPYLALFFKGNQGVYWKLRRELVGTTAGIDFVDKLWEYLKSHNAANYCVRYLTVMVDESPVLMGCMHQDGRRVATRLTPIKVAAGRLARAGATKLFFCAPDNCLCESVCIDRISLGH